MSRRVHRRSPADIVGRLHAVLLAALLTALLIPPPAAGAQSPGPVGEGLEGLAKEVVFRAAGSVGGKIAGDVDAIVISPLVAYFTTGETERLGAAYRALLESGVAMQFPALGIAINAGRVVIGGSTYAVLRLYEAADERQIDRIVFGGSRFDLLRDLRNPLRGHPSFFEVAGRKFGITEVNIAVKVKTERRLREIWDSYTSPLRGMPGSIRQEADRGWPRLRDYWKAKTAELLALKLRDLARALETEARKGRGRVTTARSTSDISGTWWLKGGGTFLIEQTGTRVRWVLEIPSAGIRHEGHGTYVAGVLSGTFRDTHNPGGLHDGEYTAWKVFPDGRKMCGEVRWWRKGDTTRRQGAGGGSDCYYKEKPGASQRPHARG
ncbi:MAG: hypothetical protein RDU83_02635 [bacterium]|nr:hypothetical protein [bacterium]